MDPKKLLEKIPRFDKDKPFRYLGRRVVQAMADAATANLLLGQRTAPGRYLVLRLVESEDEKEEWEGQFSDSRAALLREVEREARARDIKLRSALDVDLLVLLQGEAEHGEAERALSTVIDPDDIPTTYARLREGREVILPRRVRTLLIESEPGEAQAYLDHRPLGVTPCRIDDLPEGEHVLTVSKPGYLLYEEAFRVDPGRPGQKLTQRAVLEPEPEMGVVDVQTFPPGARVTIGGEARDAPARWRLPAGPGELWVEMTDFAPQVRQVVIPPTSENRPHRIAVRLDYTGPQAEEEVGRLIIYKPGTYAAPRRPPEPARQPVANTIGAFFRDADEDRTMEWDLPGIDISGAPDGPVVLGERALTRGILLIGREDPGGGVQPDIKLFDAENSVSRGCHAWLWVYADTSTGATYNTFLIGNNSPAGIRVDGAVVMESRRLAEDSEIEIGNFRLRVVKTTPEPRVEF